MDDLNGLDWSSSSSGKPVRQNPMTGGSNYYTSTLQSTPPLPLSGRSTPSNIQQQPPQPKSANDSFSNLVSFRAAKSTSNLSLQERQRLIEEQKRKEVEHQQQKLSVQYGGSQHNDAWSSLGSGRTSDRPPVDSPKPALVPLATKSVTEAFDDDDDPFELKSASRQPTTVSQLEIHSNRASDDEDDVLGLLGKPVSAIPPKTAPASPRSDQSSQKSSVQVSRDLPAPVQALVDMGFPEDKSRDALASTSTGDNLQAAIGILLNNAHTEAKQKAGVDNGADENPVEERARSRRPNQTIDARPSWMQDDAKRSRDGSASSNKDKDISKIASEVGNNLFKSANSLWNTGRKKVQKAVTDFQHEGDPNQPKWMRESSQARGDADGGAHKSKASNSQPDDQMTNEAALLESNDPRPAPRKLRSHPESGHRPGPRTASPALPVEPDRPVQRTTSPATAIKAKTTLRRGDVDEEFANAYISPNRRRRAPVKPAPPKDDVLFDQEPSNSFAAVPQTRSNNPFHQPTPPLSKKPTSSTPPRPPPPQRQIPSISPQALQTSHKHRQAGTAHFKRGDYASAHGSYTSAMTAVPQAHPLTIVILTNRSLTSLKTGSPKQAISDADTVLALIGPSRGEGESITIEDSKKDMREYFSKALARKAEALEAMEKWNEAASIWKEAVQAGVGGPLAIQGRDRCEKAAGKPKATPPVSQSRTSRSTTTQPRRPARPATVTNTQSTEAVNRLRAANKAAEVADDEKFALADTVDAKLVAWKGGKADNLRALLGSLDTVLWPEAGWKKIGMADLVLPNKVKIHYMKGIAKVHPDKIPTDATTEQRMISAAVFSVLNEAWDKFKAENGL